MLIKNITFDENTMPKTVGVEMTIEEAALIANLMGQVVPSSPESTGIYNTLAGYLFNRCWDDGVDEAVRDLGIRTYRTVRPE